MNLLGCLDTPTSGLYELNGANVSEMDDNELARSGTRRSACIPNIQPAAAGERVRNVECR